MLSYQWCVLSFSQSPDLRRSHYISISYSVYHCSGFIVVKRKMKQGGESCFSEAFQEDKGLEKTAFSLLSTMSSPLRQQATRK